MRTTNLFVMLALMGSALFAQEAKKDKDIKAIKDMCGCYEVKFNFAETFNNAKDSTYTGSPVKRVGGLEWVQLVEDNSDKIVMQHLLVVSDSMVIKHWRQDWLYENTELYTYDKGTTWKYNRYAKEDVAGQWTQKVYQVDDSPRYEGTATWIHEDGRSYWANVADAPLPRREYTIRNDYDVLQRRNVHEITDSGWLHEQDNKKVVRKDGAKDFVLAEEKGYDVYTKVADTKCLAAQTWWKENQQFWKLVRTKWDKIFDRDEDLVLYPKVDRKTLFSYLFSMDPNSSKKEINQVLDNFLAEGK
ncbi:DUF6607 family protein [Robertkochia solimangrovi]|uniref:DUF6607 family protein n=1 Tax=Robertkochia solimangrovi TaxID=2213046 RepID=UPI001180B9E1|nr:DUF6607 family protein [Robertkochia solimangrovi]TRZ45754.1 hypothetical protein DMZ48_00290 [Robertkochia solimangrovi]